MLRNLLLLSLLSGAAGAAEPPRNGVPLFFIANHGQAPPAVKFMVEGSGLRAWFTSEEAVLRGADAAIRMQFVGSRQAVTIEGVKPLPGRANFLIGPEEEWRLDVPLYGAVVYWGLYPGIDMVYGGNGRNLKSEFMVSAGADPAVIQMRYAGAGSPRIEEDGSLVLPVGGQTLREEAPVMFQEIDGQRVEIRGRFRLGADGTVGFQVGEYDVSRPLIIDPVLSYSTLVGGSGSDAATAVAVDSKGAAYVAGFTASRDFPTATPAQNFNAGGNDLFVAKIVPSGNGLVYCSYLGGSGDDRAFGLALDGNGSAHVTGFTTSANFPLKNAAQSKLAGAKNAFVLKLSPTGNSLIFSTYLGGGGSDTGYGIAVDGSGNVYVAGDTTSLTLPANGLQRGNRGAQDGFVSKFSATGGMLYTTYLGGANDDHAAALAVDSDGTAVITGFTWSTDFPLANAMQNRLAGGQDAFVARLSSNGGTLLNGTYLGGSGGMVGYPETGQGIALDAQGNIYVAGVSSSTDFPLLHPVQASRRGSMDAFVTKLSVAGALVYSTYLGGSGIDTANAIAVDANGNAYVAGQTLSTNLAVVNAVQTAPGGDYDAFLAQLSAAGDTLAALTYLGGSGADTSTSVALDSSGNVYLAGWTLSPNFPVLNGFLSTNAGNYGAFLAKISMVTLAGVSVTPASGSGASQSFAFQFSDSAGAADLATVSVLFQSSTTVSSACSVTYNRAANTLALLTDAGVLPGGTIVPGSGTQQNSQCVLNGAGSSVSIAGNTLTLNLAITFQAAFNGSRNIYLQAANAAMSTGWQQRGSWTVTSGPPATVSVSPSSGSGRSQTFSFVYSDPRGYAAISSASVIINSTLYSVGACYLYYNRAANALYLSNDASSALLGPVTPGQSGTVQNSQCSLSGTGSSASGSGDTLTLTVAVTFQAAFTGAKNIYLEAYDGADSGWQQRGTWTVTVASGPPATVSVTPASGSGSTQTFSFVYSDPRGYAAISSASVIINATLYSVGACYLYYNRAVNALYLSNDASSVLLGPVTPGQSGTVQNSQCSVSGAGSSVSGSGTNLTLNVAVSFLPAFVGAKKIYMEAYDGADSGWQQRGSWTVTTGPPAAVSVSPSSGSGSGRTFSFVYSDPRGYAAINSASVIINSTLYSVGACYLYYNRAGNALYLANNGATLLLGPLTPGQSGTVQNSQCTVNGAGSSVYGSGNELTLNVAISFSGSFQGSRNIYLEVFDGADSGWQQRGSWTIP